MQNILFKFIYSYQVLVWFLCEISVKNVYVNITEEMGYKWWPMKNYVSRSVIKANIFQLVLRLVNFGHYQSKPSKDESNVLNDQASGS